MNRTSALLMDERGATMAEYGLMVSLVALVCVAGVTIFGTGVSTLFTRVVAVIP